jgi:hypothetical protein
MQERKLDAATPGYGTVPDGDNRLRYMPALHA